MFSNMFGRPDRSAKLQFAASFKDVLQAAAGEAGRLGHEYVGTEHLLLALLLPGSDGHAQLSALGVNPADLQARIEAAVRPGTSTAGTYVPYTSRAKKVLELAMQVAAQANREPVETGFLLLGLLLEGKGIAAQVLTDAGITTEAVRAAFIPKSGQLGETGLTVYLASDTKETIAAQIARQISEAVATGQIKPGDRLPTVRALAEQLKVAPGTVALAYGELERIGAVQTDGARGTVAARRADPQLTALGRILSLTRLLRPIAVQAYQMGATADDLQKAMEQAVKGLMLNPEEK